MHGSEQDAALWLGEADDLPYQLGIAEQGYDVWLGNSRGTRYSSVNRNQDSNTSPIAYWDFTWADMGRYDVPAFIDKILEETGHSKVTYIGYGQGSNQIFYSLATAEEPEYEKKLNKVIALVPCIYKSSSFENVGSTFY